MNFVSDIIDKANDGDDPKPSKISKVVKTKLNKTLRSMIDDCSDIIGAMVSSTDGMAWAERLQDELDPHRFAAMSSALLALADNVTQETHNGTVKDVLVQSDAGNVFIMHAGNNLLLTVFSKGSSNIGMPLAHARKSADDISEMNL